MPAPSDPHRRRPSVRPSAGPFRPPSDRRSPCGTLRHRRIRLPPDFSPASLRVGAGALSRLCVPPRATCSGYPETP
eukprot:364603-Prorocentrum_minimum.AAC.4